MKVSLGGKQLAVGLVAGKTKTKDMENAEDFKRNCDILPDEISEKYIDNLRQQLTDYVNGKARWMAPEHEQEGQHVITRSAFHANGGRSARNSHRSGEFQPQPEPFYALCTGS